MRPESLLWQLNKQAMLLMLTRKGFRNWAPTEGPTPASSKRTISLSPPDRMLGISSPVVQHPSSCLGFHMVFSSGERVRRVGEMSANVYRSQLI